MQFPMKILSSNNTCTNLDIRRCQFSFRSHIFSAIECFFKAIWLANMQKSYIEARI